MRSGLVFNIQRYSLHDGPGIRTTVFLKGCPLRCAWCHNPEGIAPRKELLLVESRCVACGECRLACPFGRDQADAGPLPVRAEKCTVCGACVEACPTGARQVVGREWTVAELLAEILRDRAFYEDSLGGVTFSGGEPLLQPEFMREMLEACRNAGIHSALDTCGFGNTDQLLALARLAPLVLYDVKLMADDRHRRHTGVSNATILENLHALDGVHANIWLRVPIIPGVNDDAENLEAIARCASSLRGLRQVNLLPYHRTGAPKHRRLGGEYSLDAVPAPSPEQLDRAVAIFRAAGIPAKVGGA